MARRHHYGFAHRVLPEMLFSDPRKFFTFLGGPEGPGLLRRAWREYGMQFPPDDRIPAEGLDGSAHELQTDPARPAILVQFPPPEEMAEAHLAVAVLDATPRYFTLEFGLNLADSTPRTVLCEWQRAGKHLNYGDGPAPDAGSFLAAVVERVKG